MNGAFESEKTSCRETKGYREVGGGGREPSDQTEGMEQGIAERRGGGLGGMQLKRIGRHAVGWWFPPFFISHYCCLNK